MPEPVFFVLTKLNNKTKCKGNYSLSVLNLQVVRKSKTDISIEKNKINFNEFSVHFLNTFLSKGVTIVSSLSC